MVEYTTHDKSDWGPGDWQHEPDKIQWRDATTGLPCLMVRNHMGNWCGYVGVAEGHPLYEIDYSGDDMADLDVHGGLTYSDHCQHGPEDVGVCHVPDPGEPDDVWWLGFDCGHYLDHSPAMEARWKHLRVEQNLPDWRDRRDPLETYKNREYVTGQVTRLAEQIAQVGVVS